MSSQALQWGKRVRITSKCRLFEHIYGWRGVSESLHAGHLSLKLANGSVRLSQLFASMCLWAFFNVCEPRGLGLKGGGNSNVSDLAHIWSNALCIRGETYISTQRTHWNRSPHHQLTWCFSEPLGPTLLLPRQTWVASRPKSTYTNCWSTFPCVFTLLPISIISTCLIWQVAPTYSSSLTQRFPCFILYCQHAAEVAACLSRISCSRVVFEWGEVICCCVNGKIRTQYGVIGSDTGLKIQLYC